MPFTLVVTQLGRANVLNPANTGTLAATITQAGVSATAITPVETATALPGEIKRLAGVGGDVVADDTLHVSALDESTDTYTCRSVALYLGDGTLFAIASGTDPLFNKAAGSNAALALDVVLTDIAATSVSFGATSFMEVPATTERQGIVELATVTEAQAGIDALRALTPASAKAAILGWLLAQDGSGSGLDADLLDGQHASAFAQLAGAIFGGAFGRDAQFNMDLFSGNPIINFSPTGNIIYNRTLNQLWLTVAGALRASLTGSDLFLFGAKAWHAGNDGSGSGLDADLLDGQEASAFMPAGAIAVSNVADAMAFRLPGGLLLQMGTHPGTFTANTDIATSFPVPFTTEVKVVVGGNGDVVAQPTAVVGINYTPGDLPTTTGFKWRTNSAGQNRLNWLAIGN